jgi:FMN-dependent NADH-azoreductase
MLQSPQVVCVTPSIRGGTGMSYLLRVDSSVRGDTSVSGRLTGLATARWLETHPGGHVVHRDLEAHPVPHLDGAANSARRTPPDQHTPAQAERWQLAEELVAEVRDADAVVLGLPLYNWGPPSTVKAWVDNLFAPGLSRERGTGRGLLGATRFIVFVSRGGGYGPEAPRYGWDHATPWLVHALSALAIVPEIIPVEMTLSVVNPVLEGFRPMMERDLAAADAAIANLW